MPDNIELTPSKETYNAIRADVDVAASFKELIDNAIDNAIRQGEDTVRVEIERSVNGDGTEVITVRDDSGGIDRDELDMLFALGESRKESIRGSIGAFGIGAKKALMRLGRAFTVASRHENAGDGFGYTIDESWIEAEDEWEVPLDTFELDAGVTELRIRNPNFEWGDKRESLEDVLKSTYQLYLEHPADRSSEVGLELVFDGNRLESPSAVEYSYAPWGKLYPRRFEGIRIAPADIDSPVELSITVGLMVEGDETEAGTDVFCQNRLVVRAARGANGGFNVADGLPKFRPESHKRLKIRAEFTTDGDAADLPWNADKSRIRSDHPVMREARQWIRDTANYYMQASYGDVPVEFFAHYTKGAEHAANGGEIAGPFDYTEQFQRKLRGELSEVELTETPKAQPTEISQVQAIADTHARLGIRCETADWFEPWMIPTYDRLLTKCLEDMPFDELTTVTDIPPVHEVDTDDLITEIETLAGGHVRAGYRYVDLEPHERPRYELALHRAAEELGRDIDGLEPTEELDPLDSEPDRTVEAEGPEQADQTTAVDPRSAMQAEAGTTAVSTEGSDGMSTAAPGEGIAFGQFSDADRQRLAYHLGGDIGSLDPDERSHRLISYLKALEVIGIDPSAVREALTENER